MEMNDRIKILRKNLKMNQEEFGIALGVTKTAVCYWESGRRSLTEQIFKSICREFNVNEIWLKTGEGEIFNNNSSLLNQLCKEYGCDDLEKNMILEYFKLSSSQRQTIKNYVQNIINVSSPNRINSSRQEADDYYQQLTIEKMSDVL